MRPQPCTRLHVVSASGERSDSGNHRKDPGQITRTERIELSPDLKTLTTSVGPAGQSEPNIFMFERQQELSSCGRPPSCDLVKT